MLSKRAPSERKLPHIPPINSGQYKSAISSRLVASGEISELAQVEALEDEVEEGPGLADIAEHGVDRLVAGEVGEVAGGERVACGA